MVSGDFNEILYACEKVVGVPRDKGEWKPLEEICQLMDCQCVGGLSISGCGLFGGFGSHGKGEICQKRILERYWIEE